MPRKSKIELAVEAERKKFEDAIDFAIGQAFQDVLFAVRQPNDSMGRREALRLANYYYRGVWCVLLSLDGGAPTPEQWIEWAIPAAEEIVAAELRRAEVQHAAA